MRYFILGLVSLLIFCAPAVAADSIQSLEADLQKLEAELPDVLKEETGLDARENYVDRILKLRAKIEALEVGAGDGAASSGEQKHIFKLVRIESSERLGEQTLGDTLWRKEFDEQSTTYTYVRDETKSKLHPKRLDTMTLGFDDYPQEIVLGTNFSIRASAVIQRDIEAGRCESGAQILPLHMDIGISGYARLLHNTVKKNTSYEIPGCNGHDGGGAAGVGARVEALVNCYTLHGAFKIGSITYEYQCEIKAAEGESVRVEKKDMVFLLDVKTDSNGKPVLDENGLYIIRDPGAYGQPSQKHFTVTLSASNTSTSLPVRLTYEPVYSESVTLENTGTVQHVAINNHSGDAAEADGAADSSALSTNSGTGSEAAAQQAQRQQKDRAKHIKYWLKHAEPVENAQAGYKLKYDKWGRVEGKAPNGTIKLSGKPDAGNLRPEEYAWQNAGILNSLNLCSLGAYVERKLAGLDVSAGECAVPDAPESTPVAANSVEVPDVVGMRYEKAMKTLAKKGLQARVGMTFRAQKSSEAGKVISQQTQPGTSIAEGTDVVLDIAMGSGAKVPMPEVVGMTYDEAARVLSNAGLKPDRVAGPYPPTADLSERVMATSLTNRIPVQLGAEIRVTVYNVYSEANAPKEPADGIPSTWAQPPPQEPAKIVKADPAAAFGGTGSSGTFKCETGMGHIPVEATGRLYPNRKNGVLETDELGMKNYICRYNMKGRQHVAQVAFFDSAPTGASAADMKDRLCGSNAMYKGLNRGKALTVYLSNGMSYSNIGNDAEIDRFINFHVDQVASKALSCSGGGGQGQATANTATASPVTNTSRGGPANPNVPSSFKCESGISSLPVQPGTRNGTVNSAAGEPAYKGYSCEYQVKTHPYKSFNPAFITDEAYLRGKPLDFQKKFCGPFSKYTGNRAISLQAIAAIPGSTLVADTPDKIHLQYGRDAGEKLIRFHIGQIAPYAAPCP